jgi:hypothetical protein
MRADAEKFGQRILSELGVEIPTLLQILQDEDRYDEFLIKEGAKIQAIVKEESENILSDNRLGGFKIEPEKLRK